MKNILKVSVSLGLFSFGFAKKEFLKGSKAEMVLSNEVIACQNQMDFFGYGTWSEVRHVSQSLAKDVASEMVTKKASETDCKKKDTTAPKTPTVDQSEGIIRVIDKYDV